jgi:cellulose synthase/poly-beta-1,6-N-acetylglucosamine synthase-like glycosyltransferase
MNLLAQSILLLAMPLTAADLLLFVEIAAATFLKKKTHDLHGIRPSVVVLVPAHNESRGILPTLADLRNQLHDADQLIVVADNCTDDTAEVAREAGARVIERHDPQRLGKGYALDFGFRSLCDEDPEIAIVIDADCRLEAGAISQLALACSLSGRPAQALYLMGAPGMTNANYGIAEFAWRIKNGLRPLGLLVLGLPCQLMGTGMAFHRRDLSRIKLATGHLAEDLDLGLQLAAAGHAPVFCPAAVVKSEFPIAKQALASQRQRWEHGHLSVLSSKVLPYAWAALRDYNWDLLALDLDAAVPPLVLFALLNIATFLTSFSCWLLGAAILPLIVSLTALALLGTSILLAWITCGRDLLTLATLASAAGYIAGKFGIYSRAFASNKKWVRTSRGDSTAVLSSVQFEELNIRE